MKVEFTKMQGTGNDFVLIDQFGNKEYSLSQAQIKLICDRRFGVGADGLLIIRTHPKLDFEMLYYNSDGRPSSMCGNGGRCIVKYAFNRKYITSSCAFLAPDGEHMAKVENQNVSLEMRPVNSVHEKEGFYLLDTGSPHYVTFTHQLDELNIKSEGATIRYSKTFNEKGVNVNFVERISDSKIKIKTYERGVEDETLSCGTGVTAASIVSCLHFEGDITEWVIHTEGGNLQVSFDKKQGSFTNIKLKGPAEISFSGDIELIV